MTGMEPLRVVLLGIAGSGKSSLGNTIFGDTGCFEVNHFPSSNPEDQWVTFTGQVSGTNIQLFDTAGLCDPNSRMSNDDVLSCCAKKKPHAFLLVLKVESLSRQEQILKDEILGFFSEKVLKYTTVVFTHGEQLPKGKSIKQWTDENEALKTLIEKCGGRVHVFDNKKWNNSQDPYRNNEIQVKALLRSINQTVETNGGGCCSLETLQ